MRQGLRRCTYGAGPATAKRAGWVHLWGGPRAAEGRKGVKVHLWGKEMAGTLMGPPCMKAMRLEKYSYGAGVEQVHL